MGRDITRPHSGGSMMDSGSPSARPPVEPQLPPAALPRDVGHRWFCKFWIDRDPHSLPRLAHRNPLFNPVEDKARGVIATHQCEVSNSQETCAVKMAGTAFAQALYIRGSERCCVGDGGALHLAQMRM